MEGRLFLYFFNLWCGQSRLQTHCGRGFGNSCGRVDSMGLERIPFEPIGIAFGTVSYGLVSY